MPAHHCALAALCALILLPAALFAQPAPPAASGVRDAMEPLLAEARSLEDLAASAPATAPAQGPPSPAARRAWQRAAERYITALNQHGRVAPLDLRLRAEVGAGRALWHAGDRGHAAAYFTAATSLWGPLPSYSGTAQPPGEAQLRTQLRDEPALADAAVAHAREAVAEARFLLAEPTYQRFVAQRVPPFRGPATRQGYDRWSQQRLMPLIQTMRTELNEHGTRAYTEVIALHVPRWEVAAAVHLATMFRVFGELVLTTPVPPDIARGADLLQAYNSYRATVVEPFFNFARTGFEACTRIVRETNLASPEARDCEAGRASLEHDHFSDTPAAGPSAPPP